MSNEKQVHLNVSGSAADIVSTDTAPKGDSGCADTGGADTIPKHADKCGANNGTDAAPSGTVSIFFFIYFVVLGLL